MLVYIKVSGTLIHVPLLIWLDYSMEELQSIWEMAAFHTNMIGGLHVHSWQQQRMPEFMLGIHNCMTVTTLSTKLLSAP